MSGRDSVRGYVYQAIIAVLESLENDEWDKIKVEPLTDKDKVDIVLQKSGIIIKAIQVKSSVNKFEKPSVEQWFDELKMDIDAKQYELVLVGNELTSPAKKYIEKVNKTSLDRIRIKNFEETSLVKEVKMNVVDYLGRYCGDREVTPYIIENMVKCLLSDFMLNGTSEKFLSKNDLISVLNKNIAIKSYRIQISQILINLTIGLGVFLWIYFSYQVARAGIGYSICILVSDICILSMIILMKYSDYYFENALGEEPYEYYSSKKYDRNSKYVNVIIKKDNILHTQKILIENSLNEEISIVSGGIKFFSGNKEVNRVWFKKEGIGIRRRIQIDEITYNTDKDYIEKTYWDEVELYIDKIVVSNEEQVPWKGIVIKFYRMYNLEPFRFIIICGVRSIPYELTWLYNKILKPLTYRLHSFLRASFGGWDLTNRWNHMKIQVIGFVKTWFYRLIGITILIGFLFLLLIVVYGQGLIINELLHYLFRLIEKFFDGHLL